MAASNVTFRTYDLKPRARNIAFIEELLNCVGWQFKVTFEVSHDHAKGMVMPSPKPKLYLFIVSSMRSKDTQY